MKGTPLSCYNGISDFSVNGTLFDTTDDTAVRQYYFNAFQNDWFATDFTVDSSWQQYSGLVSNVGDTYTSGVAVTNW